MPAAWRRPSTVPVAGFRPCLRELRSCFLRAAKPALTVRRNLSSESMSKAGSARGISETTAECTLGLGLKAVGGTLNSLRAWARICTSTDR